MNELSEMKNANLQLCDKSELVDIKSVKIDKNLSSAEKMIMFIEQIKNPYLFKVEDAVVKVKFCNNKESFQQKMENIVSSKIIK